ncbi:MAG: hypothetical protein ABIH59_01095 [archaeon]
MNAVRKKIMIILLILLILVFLAVSFIIFFKKSVNLNCDFYSVDNCPSECVVCPPCIYCSSISCQTEEFCASMGFDKDWYGTYVVK